MDAPPTAAPKSHCCVCVEPGSKHCTKCKSRHYCSKKCQVVYWREGGHKEKCKQMTAEFQDRLLDVLMPAKLKIEEEPPIVEDVAAGSRAAAHLPAVRKTATAVVKAAVNDAPDWRGTCAICLDKLPLTAKLCFYVCCCKKICTACSVKYRQHDARCPMCRAPPHKSDAEWLGLLQKNVDKGGAIAQSARGQVHHLGQMGFTKKLAFQLYELAAAQGYASAQTRLGQCYEHGLGVEINFKTALLWLQRAAEQDILSRKRISA